jgi:starch synthase
MRIAICSAEVAPFAKVGGLADVIGSLPAELAKLGHDVVVMMPAYGMVIDDPAVPTRLLSDDVLVRVSAYRLVRARVWETVRDGVRHWLIEGDGAFSRVRESASVYTMHRDDYLFFTRAVVEVCETLNWIPEVVSSHDWHMGLISAVIRTDSSELWNSVGTTFTIHNFSYQGEFGFDTLDAVGLSHDLYNPDQLETFGTVNFLKAGCAMSNQVNTVSPTYAHEIQTPEYGCRLEGLMVYLAGHNRLRGILNGIDVQRHDPATDPELAAHFSREKLDGKRQCRLALIKELGLNLSDTEPLLAVISRLSNQKGFDLMLEASSQFLAEGAGWVVLGQGDPRAAEELRKLEALHPGKVRFIDAFDPQLAQRIYGGSDIFLMPSSFEPCGLGQMFAMRYGTVPVVRKTGGLADTVTDEVNGFVFEHRSSDELARCTARAIKAFRNVKVWQPLMRQAMSEDFSWATSAGQYVAMFHDAIRSQLSVAQNNPGVTS